MIRNFRQLLTVTLKTDGAYTKGRWSETTSTSTISASVQPLTGQEINTLPENRRAATWLKLYSSDDIPGLTGNNPATITINSLEYEIYAKLPWQNGLISHYKYLVVANEPGYIPAPVVEEEVLP